MDSSGDLGLLLASRHPLLFAEERDEQRFLGLVRREAEALGIPVWTWSAVRGLAREGSEPQYQTVDVGKALKFVSMLIDPGVFVFLDVHPALADPIVVRSFKEIAERAPPGQTLVLTGPTAIVPPELAGLAVSWKLKPPAREELQDLVRASIQRLVMRNLAVALDAEGERAMVDAVSGLPVAEAERLIQQAALKDGRLDESDVAWVRAARAHLLDPGRVLELVGTAGTLDAVGGMQHLKEWLRMRGQALEPHAKEFGLEAPRGILLTGVPGCGKSLVAKTLAGTWGLPLVLLDPGRLYAKYVGESEQRLEEALRSVDAMAPIVLWIDEIEKGFPSDTGGDSGVSERLLGSFLRWMQERAPGVFVVATANHVSSMPAEFLRKGRFDEVFFVDLPTAAERRAIFQLHLAKRHRDPAIFDLAALAAASEGYSGAEIEAAVVGALYRAYGLGADLSTELLLEEVRATVPLSRSRAEDVAALRAWATHRAVAV